MRDEYEITESVQVMIDDGHPVGVATCIEDDINVTTPRDLLRCNLLVAEREAGGHLHGANVKLADGAQLSCVVIGSNVEVAMPISIRNSVVFDNTYVGCAEDLNQVIVMPDLIVDCSHDAATVRALA